MLARWLSTLASALLPTGTSFVGSSPTSSTGDLRDLFVYTSPCLTGSTVLYVKKSCDQRVGTGFFKKKKKKKKKKRKKKIKVYKKNRLIVKG